MVYLALINRIGEVFNTRGIHIAIDGKGLRAAARKVKGEKTPYILNAIHGNGGGGGLPGEEELPGTVCRINGAV